MKFLDDAVKCRLFIQVADHSFVLLLCSFFVKLLLEWSIRSFANLLL